MFKGDICFAICVFCQRIHCFLVSGGWQVMVKWFDLLHVTHKTYTQLHAQVSVRYKPDRYIFYLANRIKTIYWWYTNYHQPPHVLSISCTIAMWVSYFCTGLFSSVVRWQKIQIPISYINCGYRYQFIYKEAIDRAMSFRHHLLIINAQISP